MLLNNYPTARTGVVPACLIGRACYCVPVLADIAKCARATQGSVDVLTGEVLMETESIIPAVSHVEPLTETRFLATARSMVPRLDKGGLDKFKFPRAPNKKDDDFETLNADFEVKKAEYQDAINKEFAKFSNRQIHCSLPRVPADVECQNPSSLRLGSIVS